MNKKSPKAKPHFSAADVQRLHALLRKRTVAANWGAGRILNSNFDGRADRGVLADLEARLKRLGGAAPTSVDQLRKCRLLARVWDQGDVTASRAAELPWFRVIVLIFILALAEKISDKRRRRSINARCKKLIRAYPGGGGKEKKRLWFSEVSALKSRCLEGQSAGMTHRIFNEKRMAVLHRIDDLQRRMADAQALLPSKQRRRGKPFLDHVSILKTQLADFYAEVNTAQDWK